MRNDKKRAKRTQILSKPRTVIRCEYTCPACRTIFQEHGLGSHVLRVRCTQCGQEIILRD